MLLMGAPNMLDEALHAPPCARHASQAQFVSSEARHTYPPQTRHLWPPQQLQQPSEHVASPPSPFALTEAQVEQVQALRVRVRQPLPQMRSLRPSARTQARSLPLSVLHTSAERAQGFRAPPRKSASFQSALAAASRASFQSALAAERAHASASSDNMSDSNSLSSATLAAHELSCRTSDSTGVLLTGARNAAAPWWLPAGGNSTAPIAHPAFAPPVQPVHMALPASAAPWPTVASAAAAPGLRRSAARSRPDERIVQQARAAAARAALWSQSLSQDSEFEDAESLELPALHENWSDVSTARNFSPPCSPP